MATSKGSQVTVVTTRDVARCRHMVNSIMAAGKPVAMDAEGIDLGPKGRMTLLQLGTADGQVFIIDLMDCQFPDDTSPCRQLLNDGSLKTFLESNTLKVIHSCDNISGALWHQFGIRLKSVFDTQVAHRTIEESKGILFPSFLRRDVLSNKYGGHTRTCLDLKSEYIKDKGFWARRPLTESMLEHVAEDVRTIGPALYEELYRLLHSRRVWNKFQEGVAENLDYFMNKTKIVNRRIERMNEKLIPVWHSLERYATYPPKEVLVLLTEDEKRALGMLKPWTKVYKDLPPSVKQIEEAFSESNLHEWAQKIRLEGNMALEIWQEKRIEGMTRHGNQSISTLAKDMMLQLGKEIPPEHPKHKGKKKFGKNDKRSMRN